MSFQKPHYQEHPRNQVAESNKLREANWTMGDVPRDWTTENNQNYKKFLSEKG